MRASARRGFTLVELLVVVTIIGILIALLFPAVQVAREMARRAQCKDHLKQIGLAAQQHVAQHGYYPTGGWGYRWAGMPGRGFGENQPGGWAYNLLPYLEQKNLHDNVTPDVAVQTPVAVYCCPSRRRAKAYPVPTCTYINLDDPSSIKVTGRTDYAACGGGFTEKEIPYSGNTYADWSIVPVPGPGAGAITDPSVADAYFRASLMANLIKFSDGICAPRSQIRPAHVRDGASNTYLVGEKFLVPEHYQTGQDDSDNQGWNTGYDFDTVRWTVYLSRHGVQEDDPRHDVLNLHPKRDRAYDLTEPSEIENRKAKDRRRFGSAHSAGWHVVLCDGAVRMISYTIHPAIHRHLGNRDDPEPFDTTQF